MVNKTSSEFTLSIIVVLIDLENLLGAVLRKAFLQLHLYKL